ncbi:MAG: winged helix DNA-binding domain-containing protein [Patescibacteria group bacterium]
MNLSDIAQLRLQSQRIGRTPFATVAAVVRHLGAVQAQDIPSALWAVGLRMKRANEQTILDALAEQRIVRTWPMRSTLHFVAREDVRWMLDLMTPRVLSAYAHRMRMHGITTATYDKSRVLFEKALKGGKALTREELYAVLESAGIPAKRASLGLHIIGRLAHEQLLCFGPRRGKQQTLVLLDEWVPRVGKPRDRDDALRELAIRYFTSHGPAQEKDLAWWSGLALKDIRAGIAHAVKALTSVAVEGTTYWMAPRRVVPQKTGEAFLLPSFDEFFVAYRDRSASLEAMHTHHINPGANGMLQPIIVVDGQVLGTWKRVITKDTVQISLHFFNKPSPEVKTAVHEAGERYAHFLRLSLELKKG